jgi:hypothetical protein
MPELVSISRFLVRQGAKGWFVYDRQRKGPALIGTDLAAGLTKERANQLRDRLSAEFENCAAPRGR